jgi:Tol biopolymer transport system component
MTFGEPELICDARGKNRSAVQPRVSKDGRYVLFAEGPWGLFHIWHTSADIQILDLETGELVDTKAMNSSLPESYPSFSSNDRWILFESRRDDGNYTRTYFAYFDKKGKVHKPFEVPAKDPEFFRVFLRSWSRPELMKEPVRITPRQFYEKALTEPIKVSN